MKDIFTGARPRDGHDRAADGVPTDLAHDKAVMPHPRPPSARPAAGRRDTEGDLPADPDEMWENMPV